jgi:Avidin family
MKHEHALALAKTSAQTHANFKSHWRNELKSTMLVRVRGNAVTGKYKSYVSSTNTTVTGPITGSLTAA